jgi:DNA-directed RNA polymerase subunit RPC12/RpoP
MSDVLRCSYCGSSDLIPYMIKYYKCNDCGRIVVSPIIVPDAVIAEEVVTE